MRGLSRPDPAKGVFETFLVVEGRPVELDAHLERLAASVAELYGEATAIDPRAAIEERARELELGRLRAALTPGENGRPELEIVTATVEPAVVFPGPERAVALRTYVLEGGLGCHKWVDRKLLEEAEANLSAVDAVPLIVDHGGTVLEASRANVFAVRDGTVFTPPADGRILPGIARSRVREVADAVGLPTAERELTIGDLIGSEEVFLAGSVRGVEPVRAVDGSPLRSVGDARERIGEELSRRWLPTPARVG